LSASSPAEAAIPLQRSNFTGTAVTIGIVLTLASVAAIITLRRRQDRRASGG
jgi:hypothetical protein